MATSKRRPGSGSAGGSGRARPETPADREHHSLTVRTATVLVAAVLAWLLLFRAPGPGPISPAAQDAAIAAGCDDLERPVVANPSRAHLESGQGFDYPDRPPAAGPHDPDPLPPDPHVHEEPVSETRAVHNLEHAYVLIWYRPEAEGGLSAETVAALEDVAREQDRVIMAPYPDLPPGRALALLAWNTRWMCPASVSSDQAQTIARAFIQAYRGTTNAPEAPRGLLGHLFVP